MSLNFKDAISNIENVVSEYEAIKKEASDKLKSSLEGVFKAFFDAHPEVKTIHWVQYTPHFNDGDECIFSVHEFHYTSTEWNKLKSVWGEEDEDDEDEEGNINGAFSTYGGNKPLEGQMCKDANELEKFLTTELFEEILQNAFGDGSWIRAHRGGFEVDDYYHD